METFLIKKGQPFAYLAMTQKEGGGRFWSGPHGHLYDTSTLYGPNPQWWFNALKKADSTLRITLGWHEMFLPYYGPGTNFPLGHPGIDSASKDGKFYAPFDMLVYEKWIDPNGGNLVDTSVVVCKSANGAGGYFGIEHARIIKPEPIWETRSKKWAN